MRSCEINGTATKATLDGRALPTTATHNSGRTTLQPEAELFEGSRLELRA